MNKTNNGRFVNRLNTYDMILITDMETKYDIAFPGERIKLIFQIESHVCIYEPR